MKDSNNHTKETKYFELPYGHCRLHFKDKVLPECLCSSFQCKSMKNKRTKLMAIGQQLQGSTRIATT